MLEKELLNFIREKEKASIPEIQKAFSLNYKYVREFVDKMQKRKMLGFDGQLYYYLFTADAENADSECFCALQADRWLSELKEEILKMPDHYRKAVKFCVEKGAISIYMLHEHFGLGYMTTARLMDWLINKGVISDKVGHIKKTLIKKEEFKAMFPETDFKKDIVTDGVSDTNDTLGESASDGYGVFAVCAEHNDEFDYILSVIDRFIEKTEAEKSLSELIDMKTLAFIVRPGKDNGVEFDEYDCKEYFEKACKNVLLWSARLSRTQTRENAIASIKKVSEESADKVAYKITSILYQAICDLQTEDDEEYERLRDRAWNIR